MLIEQRLCCMEIEETRRSFNETDISAIAEVQDNGTYQRLCMMSNQSTLLAVLEVTVFILVAMPILVGAISILWNKRAD